jgi:hypothetical protein
VFLVEGFQFSIELPKIAFVGRRTCLYNNYADRLSPR